MKDKIKNIKKSVENEQKQNGENELERIYIVLEEEKRTKPNSKDVCVDVFVNVRMERLKTEQIVCNIHCKTFTRD